jgi:hypothetical protein
MSAVPITIIGAETDANGSRNVTIVGMANITGLEVGGGPMPGGPSGAHPAHPIYYPDAHPEHPIVIPPEIWPNPPEGTAPHPEHPIVIPPPEGLPDGTPPVEIKTIWTPENGWQLVLVPTGDHVTPSGRRR